MSYEGMEKLDKDGPLVNSSASRNCAKKSSSALVAVRGGKEGGVRGVLKAKGLRGDDDDWEDELFVKADGAEFRTSRLKKSSTVGSNEKDWAAEGASVSMTIVGLQICGCGCVSLGLRS